MACLAAHWLELIVVGGERLFAADIEDLACQRSMAGPINCSGNPGDSDGLEAFADVPGGSVSAGLAAQAVAV